MKGRTLLIVLVLISISCGLFSICLFSLLAFVSVPIPLIFATLISGFSIAGAIASRLKQSTFTIERVLPLLVASIVFSTLSFFVLFRLIDFFFGETLTPDFRYSIWKTIGAIFLTAAWFLPFFVSYGLIEIAGYRLSEKLFPKGAQIAYAIYLFSTAISYLLFRQLIAQTSPWPLIGSSLFLLAACMFLARSAHIRRGRILFTLGLSFVLLFPKIDALFMRSVAENDADPQKQEVLFSGWSRYCQFSLIRFDQNWIRGYYNNVALWQFPRGDVAFSAPERTPFNLIGPGKTILILGSGGGTHVKLALQKGARRVVAVETVPIVIDVLQNKYADSVERIYSRPNVQAFRMDGRKYLESSHEKFDLILLAFVESDFVGTRTLFEPSERLFTLEAFELMKTHLSPNGVIAIAKNIFVDNRGLLFYHYLTALQQIGLKTAGFVSASVLKESIAPDQNSFRTLLKELSYGEGYLILASNDKDFRVPDSIQKSLNAEGFHPASSKPGFAAIMDDNPFRITPLFVKVDRYFFPLLLLIASLITVALALFLLRSGSTATKPDSSNVIAAFLIGMNFLILESALIIALLGLLSNSLDAVITGTIVFLIIASAGSIFGDAFGQKLVLLLAIIGGLLLLISPYQSWMWFVGFAASTFVSGNFFPGLLRANRNHLPQIYGTDALGTVVGGIVAFSVPIFSGYSVFAQVTAIVFIFTAILSLLTRLEPASPAPNAV